MTTKKETMQANIIKHGNQLNDIFNTEYNSRVLCRKLYNLEKTASNLAVNYCNGTNGVTTDRWEELSNNMLKRVFAVLNIDEKSEIAKNIFINGDPRGYAIKIKDSYVRENNLIIHRDFGGYGIIAPDFN